MFFLVVADGAIERHSSSPFHPTDGVAHVLKGEPKIVFRYPTADGTVVGYARRDTYATPFNVRVVLPVGDRIGGGPVSRSVYGPLVLVGRDRADHLRDLTQEEAAAFDVDAKSEDIPEAHLVYRPRAVDYDALAQ